MTTVKRVEVRAFRELLICDCGAEMDATGTVLDSYPPLYLHLCPACGKKTNARGEPYPRIVHEDVTP